VWVVDRVKVGGVEDKPARDGRGTDASAGGRLLGVGTELVFGVTTGIAILAATFCAYAAFIVSRRRRVARNVARKDGPSPGNSYVLAAGATPVSRQSADDLVDVHETAAAAQVGRFDIMR